MDRPSPETGSAAGARSRLRLAGRVLLCGILVLVLCVAALVGGILVLQRIGWIEDHRRSIDPIPPAVAERRDAIEAELDRIGGHPWAGVYFHGGVLGPALRLHVAPDSGVATVTSGDLGVFGTNEGEVAVARDGRLDFHFNDPDERFLVPEDAYPVHWGARRYLVPEDRLMDFVGAINLSEEPRDHFTGRFLLAEGDEDKPVQGLPELPDGYAAFLRTEALELGVEAVRAERIVEGSYCRWQFHLSLDRGLDDGVVPGLRLRALPPSRVGATVTVVSSTPTSAVGAMSSYCALQEEPRPDATMRLTTGAMGQPVPRAWGRATRDCPPADGEADAGESLDT